MDADSGYYGGDAVGCLLSEGIDLCIPDSNTAGYLRRCQLIGAIRSKKQSRMPALPEKYTLWAGFILF